MPGSGARPRRRSRLERHPRQSSHAVRSARAIRMLRPTQRECASFPLATASYTEPRLTEANSATSATVSSGSRSERMTSLFASCAIAQRGRSLGGDLHQRLDHGLQMGVEAILGLCEGSRLGREGQGGIS